MKYKSTRDNSLSVTFEQAICSGYAADGGLFVPQFLPKVEELHLKEWSKMTYPELSFSVLRLFISTEELSDDDLNEVCRATFAGFHNNPEQAVPVIKIGSIYIVELFHGPTFCFKDFGMRLVVNILSHFTTLRKRKTTLLVSTTGDTGPAAVQAVNDAANPLLTILVHFPKGQISDFQRRSLTTVRSPLVRVVAFEGGGDDMDAPIKRILATTDKSPDRILCGVNSYNIGRPLMQMVHFIWTYLRVVEQLGVEPGDPDVVVDIVLPTGAMGNIAGGYMAKKMGVPIGMLCAGTNVNDITYRVMQTGEFHKSESMKKTLSDAINIQVPYNFERLLYYLTDGNDSLVKEWMTSVEKTTKLDLDPSWLARLQRDFCAARITDEVMCETTRMMQEIYGYTVDPHTAVAVAAAESLGYSLSSASTLKAPVAILSTASPCKFEESVTVALGEEAWKAYFESGFPESGKAIMTREEIEPTVYVQGTDWESLARVIVTELGQIDESAF